jgi:hypothetical protein
MPQQQQNSKVLAAFMLLFCHSDRWGGRRVFLLIRNKSAGARSPFLIDNTLFLSVIITILKEFEYRQDLRLTT